MQSFMKRNKIQLMHIKTSSLSHSNKLLDTHAYGNNQLTEDKTEEPSMPIQVLRPKQLA